LKFALKDVSWTCTPLKQEKCCHKITKLRGERERQRARFSFCFRRVEFNFAPDSNEPPYKNCKSEPVSRDRSVVELLMPMNERSPSLGRQQTVQAQLTTAPQKSEIISYLFVISQFQELGKKKTNW